MDLNNKLIWFFVVLFGLIILVYEKYEWRYHSFHVSGIITSIQKTSCTYKCLTSSPREDKNGDCIQYDIKNNYGFFNFLVLKTNNKNLLNEKEGTYIDATITYVEKLNGNISLKKIDVVK